MSATLHDAVTLAADLMPLEPQTLAESTLETAISVACAELSMATTDEEQRQVFARIQDLHSQRTVRQVERMERARGLRK